MFDQVLNAPLILYVSSVNRQNFLVVNLNCFHSNFKFSDIFFQFKWISHFHEGRRHAYNWLKSFNKLSFNHARYVNLVSFSLTLSWRRQLSYRNQSIDLLGKSMDWSLYDTGLRHERVKSVKKIFLILFRLGHFRELKGWGRLPPYAESVLLVLETWNLERRYFGMWRLEMLSVKHVNQVPKAI